jgi:hypothetical protein
MDSHHLPLPRRERSDLRDHSAARRPMRQGGIADVPLRRVSPCPQSRTDLVLHQGARSGGSGEERRVRLDPLLAVPEDFKDSDPRRVSRGDIRRHLIRCL